MNPITTTGPALATPQFKISLETMREKLRAQGAATGWRAAFVGLARSAISSVLVALLDALLGLIASRAEGRVLLLPDADSDTPGADQAPPTHESTDGGPTAGQHCDGTSLRRAAADSQRVAPWPMDAEPARATLAGSGPTDADTDPAEPRWWAGSAAAPRRGARPAGGPERRRARRKIGVPGSTLFATNSLQYQNEQGLTRS